MSDKDRPKRKPVSIWMNTDTMARVTDMRRKGLTVNVSKVCQEAVEAELKRLQAVFGL